MGRSHASFYSPEARHRVVCPAHPGGAHRVEDGGGDVPGQSSEFFVALVLRPGPELFWPERRQRALRMGSAPVAREPHAAPALAAPRRYPADRETASAIDIDDPGVAARRRESSVTSGAESRRAQATNRAS